MDAKGIIIVILTWLWQTTTTFVILLIAGMLGIGLVDGLQSSEARALNVAPAIVGQRSAYVDEWHPELCAAGWTWRPGMPRHDVSTPMLLICGSHVQNLSFDKE